MAPGGPTETGRGLLRGTGMAAAGVTHLHSKCPWPTESLTGLATYSLFHRVAGERAHVSLETTQAENPTGAGIFPL